MINTVLENDSCFGVLMVNFLNGKITKVGYCSKVIRFQRLPDDCMKVLILGQRRFRLLDTVLENPIEWDWQNGSTINLHLKMIRPLADEV